MCMTCCPGMFNGITAPWQMPPGVQCAIVSCNYVCVCVPVVGYHQAIAHCPKTRYPVGIAFGLGFDTSSEVAVLAMVADLALSCKVHACLRAYAANTGCLQLVAVIAGLS